VTRVAGSQITLEELRSIDLFADLDDPQLAEWVPVTTIREVPEGVIVAEQDQPVRGVELLLEGSIATQLVVGDRVEPSGRQVAPTWMGAIAVLTEGNLGVRMVSLGCRIGLVEAEDFRRLAFAQPSVHRRVMLRIAPVMSRITSLEQNRERLTSLGTMAAGLAHELNNPAAAARRAAAQMAEALEVLSTTIGRFVESGIERHDAELLLALQREALSRAAMQTALSSLDAADAEDALLDRLEELEIPEAWKLVEPLIAAGLDEDWVDRVAAIAGGATDGALRWVAASLTAQGLAQELQESTKRMSALVGAVKSYAYMDRGDLVEVDLHEGLETTITILGHKLKQTTIKIVRDYDRTLPHLTVRGSELNQVWTNLLDNAIDALGQTGTITITTRNDQGRALVEITDDGPGIPPEVQSRVFDAFFTTKDVGEGTGLGLATVYRIVVDRHAGGLTFESRPGRTTFRVSLPFTQVT
jgi:signal transduction histidine kinase